MTEFNIKQYLENKKREYEELINLIDQMEDTGKNYAEHRGVAYNRTNVIGKMSRLESQIEGAGRYVKKMREDQWQETHAVMVEKLAEQEYDYHLYLDGGHNLNTASNYIRSVLEKEGNNLSLEAQDALKNSMNKVNQTATYLSEKAKKAWIRDRFFELASKIDFNDNSDNLFPVNIKELEEVHPLDIVNNGHVKLESLKESNHHKNVFLDKVTKIKKETLKELLLSEEMENPEVAKDF